MLKKLVVKNFAIIDESEIEFKQGFNVITGETGAGKSILLGALSLILGQRADKNAILDSSKKSIIEGEFSINKANFSSYFEANDLDFAENTFIRRELLATGKSRAFINDTPVTLDVLKELSSQLVDLHQQHESLSLTSAQFQREIVDIFANQSKEVKRYNNDFNVYSKAKQTLKIKLAEEKKNRQEKDFLEFQFNELEKANLKLGELEEIEDELSSATNFDDIQEGVQQINSLLSDDEAGAIQMLRTALVELRKLNKIGKQFESLEKQLNSALIEIEDVDERLQHLENDLDVDPERIEELTKRVDQLNRLMSKHHTINDEELVATYERIKEQLNSFESTEDEIKKLQKQIAEQEKQLTTEAGKLSKSRKKVIPEIEKQAKQLLSEAGMPKATLQIQLKPTKELTAFGIDELAMLFTANVGQSPKELKSVASGGELSRLMLAIKTLIAGKSVLPTMIFDEIDTGISGEVANKVGKLLQKLAAKHQIISITHLPQIAAKGNHHLKVFKQEINNVTRSQVKTISENERVVELAEMLSGANPSITSLQAARELMS